MKKILTLSLLLLATVSLQAQFKADNDDFTAKFKLIFEAAKKRFATEKTGEKRTIKEDEFIGAYGVTTTFNNAHSSRLLVDSDNLLAYEAQFKIGTVKEDAKKVLADMVELLKNNLPAKFIMKDTYEMNWADPKIYAIEYDSEVFAIQAKQPSAKIGVIERDGNFLVRLLIFEPIFK
jgi:hypothetical protein